VAASLCQKYLKVDLAIGCENGQIRLFELSPHFSCKVPLFESVATWNQVERPAEDGLQVKSKKCGLLKSVKSIRLSDCDSISFIKEVSSSQLKLGSKPNQYILIASLNCLIYVISYNNSE